MLTDLNENMNIRRLYDYLLRNHYKKPCNISIWEYIQNTDPGPAYIKSGKHNSTFLKAKELEKQGLIEIQLHDGGNRAFLKVL
jgi:hypothetical protein